MKKLILSEDIEEDVVMVDNEPVAEVDVVDTEVLAGTNLISQMIKGEWDAIDLYNSMIPVFQEQGNEDAVKVISDIVKEEYIHVGQLEKLMQNDNPVANAIEEGSKETEEQVGEPVEDVVIPAEEVEVEA